MGGCGAGDKQVMVVVRSIEYVIDVTPRKRRK